MGWKRSRSSLRGPRVFLDTEDMKKRVKEALHKPSYTVPREIYISF